LEGLKGFRKAGMRVKRNERLLGGSTFVEFLGLDGRGLLLWFSPHPAPVNGQVHAITVF
jgi:hypothetical protein